MFGEKLFVAQKHKDIAIKLAHILLSGIDASRKKYLISIAGESGSGKSGIAYETTSLMNKRGVKTILLQQDDYFYYPPKTNRQMREKDISVVGTNEVNLELLTEHVKKFKDLRTKKITKPLIVFDENKCEKETVSCKTAKVMIVEGTYVSLLKNIDRKIFLTETYIDTFKGRRKRARDKVDVFDKKVLEIEHKIVSGHKKLCHIIVRKDASIRRVKRS